MENKVAFLLEKLPAVIWELKREQVPGAFLKIQDLLVWITECIQSLFAKTEEYQRLGIEIPQEVILNQLKNLLEAVEMKDITQLLDCFEYEILETLRFYEEILKIENNTQVLE